MLGILTLSCVQQLETFCAVENLPFHPRNQAGLSWVLGKGVVFALHTDFTYSLRKPLLREIGGQDDERQ